MDLRRAIVVILLAAMVGGGVAIAVFGTGEVDDPPEPERARESESAEPRPPPALLPPGTPTRTDQASAPPAAVGERGDEAGLGRVPRAPGDDPALREAIEVQAALAAPFWARLAPRVADPELRAEAAAMIERLRTLSEPSGQLARDEYDLTQRLITLGGWEPALLREVQYLNSTAAAVLQGGDPADVEAP